MLLMDTPTRILVCGGGNGAHTLAATAAAMTNVEVNVMTLYSDEAQRWRNILGRDSIVVEVFYNDGSTGKLEGKPRMITKDPAKSMEGVDAIFFVVPAFAHQQYFEAITKYIKPNTIVIGMPGQAGFEFQALKHLKDAAKLCGVISLESLPWACRILEFGRRVQVLGFKDVLGASVIPGKGNEQISDDSSLRSCMVTNSAYNGLLHPMKKVEGGYVPDFNFRYTAEDVPFGLVVMKGIAECVGMKTPTLDEVIVWAQEKLGKEYVVGSRLKGKDVGETRAPQAFGFTTINDLCSVL
ncbi:OCDH-like protein [Mya arenaria]|uniref:OCDH-like protein n=1 Tax=Mya arenaria TaxID=6604 RepID=A0ABY7FQX0_MYAAR|nr:OCDH-like protein [Mya arenaria]WAR23138.1 OCDH-like protein [Mya arenaria]